MCSKSRRAWWSVLLCGEADTGRVGVVRKFLSQGYLRQVGWGVNANR